MIEAHSLILIGSTARNSGKTTLACELAQQLEATCAITALKVTRITDGESGCPHGEHGCGLCEQFEGGFCLERETDVSRNKDTSLLLASGIEHVYWLRTQKESMAESYQAFEQEIDPDHMVICESNSLREYVHPLVFIMLAADSCETKPSAQAVMEYADLVIPTTRLFEDKATVVQDVMAIIRERYSAAAC